MTTNSPHAYPYSVEVNGIQEAHADTIGEAVALAHRIRGTFDRLQTRTFVAVVDNRASKLVPGWWLLDDADLEGITCAPGA